MNRFAIFFGIFIVLGIQACHKDKDNPPEESTKSKLEDVLTGIDSLKSFTTDFKSASLAEEELSQGITVFTLSDRVLADVSVAKNNLQSTTVGIQDLPRLRAANGTNGSDFKDGSSIKDYIVKGRFSLSDLTADKKLTTLSGKTITVQVVNGIVYLNGVQVFNNPISNNSAFAVFALSSFINYGSMLALDNQALAKAAPCIPGGILTILGQNFSEKPEQNLVTLNGKNALVNAASKNKLVITIPAEATTGLLTVAVNNKTVSSLSAIPVLLPNISTVSGIQALGCQHIQGIAVDNNNTLYFTDPSNHRTLSYDASGHSVIYQPLSPPVKDINGDGKIDANDAELIITDPWAITLGNDGKIYVGGKNNEIPGIFRFSPNTPKQTEHWAGSSDLNLEGRRLNTGMSPIALLADGETILYANNFSNQQYVVNRIAGDNIMGWLYNINLLNVDPTYQQSATMLGMTKVKNVSTFYFADGTGKRIWKKDQNGLYLLAGANNNNHKPAQDGQGNAALFGSPMGIALWSDQYIVVCDNDYNNHNYSIRIVNSYGVVTTIAGGNNPTNSSKDGIGKAAQFDGVNAIAVDKDNMLYVASDDGSIRKIQFK
ncbi:IPT/TIG domain-containing protein [Sphingobacterium siyangense]|jgi:sugar lactone lactonase YvrE|uniref:IPT/TIG domain-containing protein n=1 Tax=Sphingobacterium siyangense TaxID=459529 RepID=UPI003DA5731C